MTFKHTFCPSPWFHMRITNSGTYEPCRWMSNTAESRVDFSRNIQSKSIAEYFQKDMRGLRSSLLDGQGPAMCDTCRVMEQHGKPSGRQRQLLKIGVLEDNFEKSLASSPMRSAFDHSLHNQGKTERMPSDWQIDLGNYCNGACVFCNPESSSTLATEFVKLGLAEKIPPLAWSDDAEQLDKFISEFKTNTNLQYLHFIGGETVITPGFKKILSRLVESGLASQVTIGFTTNLTVWSESVVELLKKFKQVNLGMSVETLTAINDYVRYPSQQKQTRELLDRWVALGRQQGWLIQLRLTPTCLTIQDLHTVYEYAWTNEISVESCNFLYKPEFLRISVVPKSLRESVARVLRQWVDQHAESQHQQIINTRNPNLAQTQIVQDAQSYLHYLDTAEDESYRLPDLIKYLKLLESNRGNSILDYLPEYEELFRSHGY